MADQSDDVIGNFWGFAENLLGTLLPNTDAKTPPLALPPTPLASAPTAILTGVAQAELAADRGRAATAAAAAAAAEAVARARAEAEARAEAATTAPFKKLRFAVPEATYAEEAARVEAEARARAGAEAAAEAKAKAEAGVQAMQAIRAAATARAEAAATARAEQARAAARAARTRAIAEAERAPAPARAEAAATATAEQARAPAEAARAPSAPANYSPPTSKAPSPPLAKPPQPNNKPDSLVSALAPGVITILSTVAIASGIAILAGSSAVASFGAIPLVLGIGAIAIYAGRSWSSSRKDQASSNKEKINPLLYSDRKKIIEGCFKSKNGVVDFANSFYLKKDGNARFQCPEDKKNNLTKLLSGEGYDKDSIGILMADSDKLKNELREILYKLKVKEVISEFNEKLTKNGSTEKIAEFDQLLRFKSGDDHSKFYLTQKDLRSIPFSIARCKDNIEKVENSSKYDYLRDKIIKAKDTAINQLAEIGGEYETEKSVPQPARLRNNGNVTVEELDKKLEPNYDDKSLNDLLAEYKEKKQSLNTVGLNDEIKNLKKTIIKKLDKSLMYQLLQKIDRQKNRTSLQEKELSERVFYQFNRSQEPLKISSKYLNKKSKTLYDLAAKIVGNGADKEVRKEALQEILEGNAKYVKKVLKDDFFCISYEQPFFETKRSNIVSAPLMQVTPGTDPGRPIITTQLSRSLYNSLSLCG